MPPYDEHDDGEVVDALDASHRQISESQRELFRLIAETDRRQLWRGSGARDMAHWLGMALRDLAVEGEALDRRRP